MTNFTDLVRLSVTRPQEAARLVLSLRPTNAVILQGALLLAILSVLLRDALVAYTTSFSPDPVAVIYPPVYIDLAEQFFGVYLVSYLTVFLARIFGISIPFARSATIYIWYNLMLSIAGFVMVGGFLLLGGLGLVLSMAIGGWAIWAAAHFWAVLMGSDKLFFGFLLAVVPVILGSVITVMLAGMLGLPMLEFANDV